LVILVIAIGKRDRNSVYDAARQRLLRGRRFAVLFLFPADARQRGT
jgi:hypothetical protein